MAIEGIMLNSMGRATVQDTELAKAYADIPYYRHKGGHAYKQHMAHIRKLERIAKSGKKEQN